jgi:hypothetical protein
MECVDIGKLTHFGLALALNNSVGGTQKREVSIKNLILRWVEYEYYIGSIHSQQDRDHWQLEWKLLVVKCSLRYIMMWTKKREARGLVNLKGLPPGNPKLETLTAAVGVPYYIRKYALGSSKSRVCRFIL